MEFFWGLGIAHFCEFLYFQHTKSIFLNSWYDGWLHFGNWRHLHCSYLGNSYSQVVKTKSADLSFPFFLYLGRFIWSSWSGERTLPTQILAAAKRRLLFWRFSRFPIPRSTESNEEKFFGGKIWNGIWNGRKKSCQKTGWKKFFSFQLD